MRHAIFMLFAVTTAGVAELDASPSPTATIRTYNYAILPSEQLALARLETESIFMNAGISVEWVECRVPGRNDGSACTEPLLAGRDLMLRLVERTPVHPERIVPLGESMLDRDQRGGVLMTVDMFPVRSVAARAATPVTTLLGRAIAHEIGHMLLGSGQHSALGLMRGLWSHDEIRGLKPAHWGFSAREAARMRRTLLGKSRTAD
jgi:hypothetical protein